MSKRVKLILLLLVILIAGVAFYAPKGLPKKLNPPTRAIPNPAAQVVFPLGASGQIEGVSKSGVRLVYCVTQRASAGSRTHREQALSRVRQIEGQGN